MERDDEDYIDGLCHILDGHNSMQAIEILSEYILSQEAKKLITMDIGTENAQKRLILEKARFEGMSAMIDSIRSELAKVNKKRG